SHTDSGRSSRSGAWGEKRVVCYYANWSVYRQGIAKFSPEYINPYLCTHLIYAFGGITEDYQLKPFDNYQDIEKDGYKKVIDLKKHNKGLKVLLAVGGWNEGSVRWSPLVADADHRKTFIRSVIRFLRTYDFDGLDLDWQYPAFRDGGRPEDKDNYAKLVQVQNTFSLYVELQVSFEREAKKSKRERLLLTMAVPAGQEYINNGYDMLVRGLLSLSYLFFLSRESLIYCFCLPNLHVSSSHTDSGRSSRSGAWGEKRVVCYYANWSVYRQGIAKFSPEYINPYLCTHLIYAFGGITEDYQLKPFDNYQDIEKDGYKKVIDLKKHNKGLKVLLAVGGSKEGSVRWSPLVADADHRKTFIRSVIRFLRTYDFDGLDLDWEYPAFRDGGRPEDKDNYAKLVQVQNTFSLYELQVSFEREAKKSKRERLLLTMAVPAGQEYINNGYDVATLNKSDDMLSRTCPNLMISPCINCITRSDDYVVDLTKLCSLQAHDILLCIENEPMESSHVWWIFQDYTVKYYLEKGADRDKLVVGIPTYGRSYTLVNPTANTFGSPAQGPGEPGKYTKEKGYLAFYEVCVSRLRGKGVERRPLNLSPGDVP
ncbi:unnamed protein product, partial [Darwinula stevensoni]